MRSPLRSKRAITSPVRARSNASGLTRIRVRLTAGAPLVWLGVGRLFRGAAGRLFALGLRGSFAGRGGFFAAGRLPSRNGALLWPPLALAAGERGLAVGAEAPARVDRLAAGRARVLEAALAVGAAEEVLLDRVLAVGTGLLAQLPHLQLRRFDLQLALVRVLEELRRPHDRVDGGADVGKEGGDGRAADQEG